VDALLRAGADKVSVNTAAIARPELLRELSEFPLARDNSTRAIALLDELVRPAPSLGIEQADARNLRARILHSQGSPAAEAAYAEALQYFQSLANSDEASRHPAFHQRYLDFLINLTALRRDRPAAEAPRRLLSDAVRTYIDFGRRPRPAGSRDGRAVVDGMSQVMALMNDGDRKAFTEPYTALQRSIEAAPDGGR